MVNLTVTVTREERKALKRIALERDTTVSMLMREWLSVYLVDADIELDKKARKEE